MKKPFFGLAIVTLFCVFSANLLAEDQLAERAHDVYSELLESGITLEARSAKVTGTSSSVTFGAEKEGSSSLITKVMGPGGEAFQTYAQVLGDTFYRSFLQVIVNENGLERQVVDQNGVDLSLSAVQVQALKSKIQSGTPQEAFEFFISLTQGRPFSYLKSNFRRRLFNGEVPGQSGKLQDQIHFGQWIAHYGKSQKYIQSAHELATKSGWEINFNPMGTYGEFEEMIAWFKSSLKNAGELFEAPGHQRLVFPAPVGKTPEEQLKWKQQVGEMYRHIQAYIIARGILGNTGIETSHFKSVLQDSEFMPDSSTGRGVIRVDMPGRFVADHYSIELRAGTKDAQVQQFVEQVITARIAAGDFQGLSSLQDWELLPFRITDAQDLVSRFKVTSDVATKFLQHSSGLSPGFDLALWRWENAPYMRAKKTLLAQATRHYIETVAANPSALKSALKEWLRTVRLEHDIQDYLRPRRIVEKLDNMHEYRSTGQVDVNKIDIGVEYTARFQGQFSVQSTQATMADGMEAWLYTKTDMTPYERREQIKKMAQTLGRELNGGRSVEVVDITNGTAHGHGMSVTFQVQDRRGRKWRVEWDGVGRTYTEDGKVIPESLRGGHMEIVTPKMAPSYEEMSAVFRAMNKMNVIPSHSGGGGHLNVDLAPFQGNPRALARFLTLFHEHRGMISFLFTNVNRVAVAEPVEVSADLSRRLRDFQGSELELKQLLYNEGYYNQRLGRKTRNVQIDMSAFFQDIIPAEHIHPDFDFKNPTEPWRPQFRVNPKIRKMEMRLFDAPIDAFESSMQIKLVKALIDKALNSDAPLSGRVQEVNHENFTRDYEFAKGELARMCQSLGLSVSEYKIFLARAFVQGRQNMSSPFYQNYQDKIRSRGWTKVRREVWGRAMSMARSEAEALSSETRQWQGSELPEARAFRERRIQAARQGSEQRQQLEELPGVRREIKIGVNCRSIFR